tara:strand:+ start:1387 stop:1671 length:285 start_codon:yes stop_codon:yes gene_type:complete
MMLAGIIAASGMLFLLFKFGVRKVITYDIFFDVLITFFLMIVLAGTFSGMMAALLGGLIVSIVLFVMKRTMRHEKLQLVKVTKFPYRRWMWVEQ